MLLVARGERGGGFEGFEVVDLALETVGVACCEALVALGCYCCFAFLRGRGSQLERERRGERRESEGVRWDWMKGKWVCTFFDGLLLFGFAGGGGGVDGFFAVFGHFGSLRLESVVLKLSLERGWGK